MQDIIKAHINLDKAYSRARSAWARGVILYAVDLLGYLEEGEVPANIGALPYHEFEKTLLNGADDWQHFSYSGCALVASYDIAERLATPSAFKASDYGNRNPSRDETWLDLQTRALHQASRILFRVFRRPTALHG